MWETKWDDLKRNNETITQKILKYNEKIGDGKYLDIDRPIDILYYRDLLVAQAINLLIDNESFCVPKDVVDSLNFLDSSIMNWVEWEIRNNNYHLCQMTDTPKEQIISQMIEHCFDESRRDFIQEICAQDIIYLDTLAKDIASILGEIYTAIEIENIGEEAFLAKMSLAIKNKERIMSLTKIQTKFGFEFSTGVL